MFSIRQISDNLFLFMSNVTKWKGIFSKAHIESIDYQQDRCLGPQELDSIVCSRKCTGSWCKYEVSLGISVNFV